jgi:hypothetical protein
MFFHVLDGHYFSFIVCIYQKLLSHSIFKKHIGCFQFNIRSSISTATLSICYVPIAINIRISFGYKLIIRIDGSFGMNTYKFSKFLEKLVLSAG